VRNPDHPEQVQDYAHVEWAPGATGVTFFEIGDGYKETWHRTCIGDIQLHLHSISGHARMTRIDDQLILFVDNRVNGSGGGVVIRRAAVVNGQWEDVHLIGDDPLSAPLPPVATVPDTWQVGATVKWAGLSWLVRQREGI
jgi:hypothetical protein